MKHFGVLSAMSNGAKAAASFDVPTRTAPIRAIGDVDRDLFRPDPFRLNGETELRLGMEFFDPLKRVYVAHPRSAKARKNKKRHQAWTLTKEFRRQAAPRLRYNSILDRQMSPAAFLIYDEADRLTNGHFSKHFNLNRNPSLDVPEQDIQIHSLRHKTIKPVISDRVLAAMGELKPVVHEGTLSKIEPDSSKTD